ncbi:NAD(P)/FAD-dependent oxidoreductase [Egbenema bharatensis]|uniref:NAD(P)/FAD-dependent oxidoreductase n=1 Tax=Egbenema bharatensis TaxID=3463334 RepID=UPI003A89C864
MNTYDWIVVGSGLTGAAVSYELVKAGFSVLLLDRSSDPDSATRYSYGGIAYWSGSTDLTRQLCQEGIETHRSLSAELEQDTQFRETNLLLTVEPDRDPEQIAARYAQVAIPPTVLSPAAAHDLEPMLDQQAIAGVLQFPHGHVSPEAMVAAYIQAFTKRGGTSQISPVTGLLTSQGRVTGVVTPTESFYGDRVLVCAGGMSRSLLASIGLSVRLYFTQAELIETVAIDPCLQSVIMPAETKRFEMEAAAGQAETDKLWDAPGHEVHPPILDPGAVQLRDGRIRMGQWSRTLTDPTPAIDATASEQAIRLNVGQILPGLKDVPGEWHQCLVSFSGDRLPLIGAISGLEGIHLFSGFSNPFAILPPLAKRFAQAATGQPDSVIAQLSPLRFAVPTS